MGFDTFRAIDLNFEFVGVQIKTIDANHEVFLRSFANHYHSFYELHYIVKGHGTLVLDNISHDLNEGDIFLIPPRVAHAQITDVKNPMEEYHYSFEIRKIRKNVKSKIGEVLMGTDFLMVQDSYDILTLFQELETELNRQDFGYEISIKNILSKILLTTSRDFSSKFNKSKTQEATPDDRRYLLLDEAFLYSYKELTLESLAHLLNLSPRQTQRLIYKKYGTTFVKLRLQSRLNASANMMISSKLTLSEIAEECGFCNYLHYAKGFREAFGMSPSEYRRSVRQ